MYFSCMYVKIVCYYVFYSSIMKKKENKYIIYKYIVVIVNI